MFRRIIATMLGLFCIIMPSLASAQKSNLKSSAPIHITADNLAVDQNTKTATFSGNVEALQESITLHSQKMVVHYTKTENAGTERNNDISKIEVFGNVVLTRPGESAKGDKGVYDVAKSTINLSGNVLLKKDQNTVQGTHLVYNLETGKSKISGGKKQNGTSGGRVRGVFVPQQD